MLKTMTCIILGAILTAAVLCGAAGSAIGGGIFFLIKKLWDKHQEKALKYLTKILYYIHKLQTANLEFMGYMNKSEEATNEIFTNLESIQANIINGSRRYRANSADLCSKAIISTSRMIKTIENIVEIDMKEWSLNQLNYDSQEIDIHK